MLVFSNFVLFGGNQCFSLCITSFIIDPTFLWELICHLKSTSKKELETCLESKIMKRLSFTELLSGTQGKVGPISSLFFVCCNILLLIIFFFFFGFMGCKGTLPILISNYDAITCNGTVQMIWIQN